MEQTEKEIWRPIKDFPDYKVSNLGHVRSYKVHWKNSRVLGNINPNGYSKVVLSKEGKLSNFYIHHLVLETFVGPCPKGHETNHKDGIKTNNQVRNLEWITHSKNAAHAIQIGLHSTEGIKSSQAKLCNEDVLEIRRIAKLGIKRNIIAERFSVTRANIDHIVNRSTWRHI